DDGIRVFHVTGVQTCALPISTDAAEPARAAQPARTTTEDQERLHRAVLARAAEGEVIVPVAVEVTGRDRARRAAERLGAALAVKIGRASCSDRARGLTRARHR